eukprot:935058-Prymnesium_polylepis.1
MATNTDHVTYGFTCTPQNGCSARPSTMTIRSKPQTIASSKQLSDPIQTLKRVHKLCRQRAIHRVKSL